MATTNNASKDTTMAAKEGERLSCDTPDTKAQLLLTDDVRPLVHSTKTLLPHKSGLSRDLKELEPIGS
jgi:hypothetical protein